MYLYPRQSPAALKSKPVYPAKSTSRSAAPNAVTVFPQSMELVTVVPPAYELSPPKIITVLHFAVFATWAVTVGVLVHDPSMRMPPLPVMLPDIVFVTASPLAAPSFIVRIPPPSAISEVISYVPCVNNAVSPAPGTDAVLPLPEAAAESCQLLLSFQFPASPLPVQV